MRGRGMRGGPGPGRGGRGMRGGGSSSGSLPVPDRSLPPAPGAAAEQKPATAPRRLPPPVAPRELSASSPLASPPTSPQSSFGVAGSPLAASAGSLSELPATKVAARTNIAREILSTEESYVSALRTIIDVYVQPLRTAGISADVISRIFSNVELIVGVNTVLLADLRQRLDNWNSDTTLLGDCLLQLTPFLKMYTEYGNQYESALTLHAKMIQNDPIYTAAIAECEQKKTTSLPLEALLIQPIQRIPRYNLLLNDLLKNTDPSHPDAANLTKVLSMMKGVADHINESIRLHESQMQFLNISSKSAGLEALMAPHRRLVKDGQLYVVPSSRLRMRKKRRFILFNDILVVAHESSTSDTMRPEYVWSHRLSWLDEMANKKNKFQLTGPQVSYVLQADHRNETEQWMQTIMELSNTMLSDDHQDVLMEDRTGRHDYIENGVEYYEGMWKNARREGTGSYHYADGTVYTGDWVEDRPTGQAVILFSTQARYEGPTIEGTPEGEGVLTMPDGSEYQGQFRNGVRHGQGRMQFADGSLFEGEWENGKFLKGVLTRNGNRYEGKFHEGRREGKGVCTYGIDGSVYDGYWRDDKRDGAGVYTSPTGGEYRGSYALGKREGSGRQRFPNGSVYDGQWRGDEMHGRGLFTYANGAVYEGEFNVGRRNGRGRLLDATGLEYDGEWRDDCPHGHGVLTTPDRKVQYDGKFVAGRMEGRCVMRLVGTTPLYQVQGTVRDGHLRTDHLSERVLLPPSLPEVFFDHF
mmetsp:Transcript_4542/g.11233  ORF Transcript_4542/g.11233 Transcript_4542/m.11233 type:complete len:753 (-) Transcript_4542:26-2284(-)